MSGQKPDWDSIWVWSSARGMQRNNHKKQVYKQSWTDISINILYIFHPFLFSPLDWCRQHLINTSTLLWHDWGQLHPVKGWIQICHSKSNITGQEKWENAAVRAWSVLCPRHVVHLLGRISIFLLFLNTKSKLSPQTPSTMAKGYFCFG